MKRIVHDCDRCGEKDISPVLAFTAFFGKSVTENTDKVDIEICVKCAGTLLALQLDSLKNDKVAYDKFKNSLQTWHSFKPKTEEKKDV